MKKRFVWGIVLLAVVLFCLSGSAEEGTAASRLAEEYKAAEGTDEKLALIRRISEENAKSTDAPLWNLYSFDPGDALDSMIPESWEDYPCTETDGFPAEAKGRPCIVIRDHEVAAYLLVRFPAEMIAESLEEAEYAIVIDSRRVKSGYTYDPPATSYHLDYYGYLLNLRTGEAKRFWYERSYAAAAGRLNELDAEQLRADQIWDGIRSGLLSEIRLPQADGSTLVFTVSGGVCFLKTYEGEPTDLTVPAEAQGVPVTAIEDECFTECQSLKSLTLPGSVTRIGKRAFRECRNLETVAFSRGLKEIEEQAFSGTGLTEARLPDGIELLGFDAFGNCERLGAACLPPSILENECSYVFELCGNLARIIVEEGKTTLMSAGFLPLDYAKYLYLPGSLEFGLEYCQLNPSVIVCAPEGSYALTCAQELGLKTIACATPEDIPDVRRVTEGNFEFDLLDGEAYLIRYTGSREEEITVPGEVSGLPVTTVANNAFSLESDVRTVRLPASVRLLKANAISWGTYNKGAELALYIPNPEAVLEDYSVRVCWKTEKLKVIAPADSAARQYTARYNELYGEMDGEIGFEELQ